MGVYACLSGANDNAETICGVLTFAFPRSQVCDSDSFAV
jgi:hypothetical protein